MYGHKTSSAIHNNATQGFLFIGRQAPVGSGGFVQPRGPEGFHVLPRQKSLAGQPTVQLTNRPTDHPPC